ncbi:hypothetical protein Chor_017119 [Crotalus horridus]
MMSSSSPPTPVQIREANAHLAALHGRVAELERRLAAAERTVHGQAESLIRKDAEMRQAVFGLREGKDSLITQLRHRSRLLTKICRSRPVLDNLLAYMAEGEQLSPALGAQSDANSPDHSLSLETNCIPDLDLDTKDFSLGDDEQDSDRTLFGTTV